jgi:3-oxoadipate enol-lactonase
MRRLLAAGLLSSGFVVACAAPGPREGTIDLGDARIHYVVAGSGPAVVLLHGWALNLREFDDQIVALSPYYWVVALDRRGYGESTGNADPSADPGDVAAVLDTLGIRSAVIVGHSAGADVAIRFAAALPGRVRALVLYGGGEPDGFPVPPPPGPSMDLFKSIARQYGLDSLWKVVLAIPMFQPGPNRTPAAAARLDTIIGAYSGKDLLEDHPESGRFPPAQFSAMRGWRFPTLFISGENERPRWKMVADSMVRWMPDAREVIVPGGGHGVHLDEPARFDAALLEFLDGLPAPGPS